MAACGFAIYFPLLPFFLVGAVMGYITGHIEATHVNGAGQLEIEMHYSIVSRCLIAGRAICFYSSKLVWPHPLMFMYPRWNEVAKPTAWQWAFPAIVILVSISLFVMRNRTGRDRSSHGCSSAARSSRRWGL